MNSGWIALIPIDAWERAFLDEKVLQDIVRAAAARAGVDITNRLGDQDETDVVF